MIAGEGACAAASSAVVGSSSSQSGRAATSSRASATRRFCPADSARTGKSATCGEAEPARAPPGPPRAARRRRARRPEGEVFARRQRAFQRVGVAEIMRLLADRRARRAALERERRRTGTAGSPRAPRSRLDLPAPFGPVTIERLARRRPRSESRENNRRPPRSMRQVSRRPDALIPLEKRRLSAAPFDDSSCSPR